MPTYRYSSRAIIRAEQRPISHNAMVVLAVMATRASPTDVEPVCFKEQESIARREIVAGMFDLLTLGPATVRMTRWTPEDERLAIVAERIEHVWASPVSE